MTVQLDARILTDEETSRIIHQVLEERRRETEDKPCRFRLRVTASRFTGALCILGAGYIMVQLARSLMNGWLPAIGGHTQAVMGGFVLGMMFMAGVVLAALAVFGVVRS